MDSRDRPEPKFSPEPEPEPKKNTGTGTGTRSKNHSIKIFIFAKFRVWNRKLCKNSKKMHLKFAYKLKKIRKWKKITIFLIFLFENS